jgi:2-desacetyl-2-hydroxyethyl bacteriochlorophyllide A dehydrogenase
MKAAILYGPRNLRVEEVETPFLPKVDEAILKVEWAALCGTDLHAYRGGVPAKTPLIAGHEYVGRILQIGREVKGLKLGDKVVGSYTVSCGECKYCSIGKPQLCENRLLFGLNWNGAFAQFMRIPRASRALVKIPEGIEPKTALLAADMFLTPLYAVERAELEPSSSVLITGLGAVGLSAVIAAKLKGVSELIGVDRRDKPLKLARELGATHLIDSRKDKDLAKRVKEFTDGLGVDVVLEASGVPEVIASALDSIRPFGKHIQIAVPKDKVCLDLRWVESLEKQIIGILNPGSATYLKKALEVVKAHNLPLQKLITHEFSLENIQEAYEITDTYKGDPIKIVIKTE